MATTNKGAGASLDPSTHAGGGQVPPGTYDIIKVKADVFTYPGQGAQVPAIMVTYRDAGVDYEQMYKAGDLDHLIPSDDGKRFIHPKGEAAAIYKGGAASMWLGSLAKQGFKFNGDDVSQIEGIRVELDNVAAPKGKSSENADKVFPLVIKILTSAKQSRPMTGKATAAATSSSTAAPASTSTVASNGLDEVAISAVMQALEAAPEHTLKVKGLAVRCLKFASGTKLNDLTKLITPEWLATQSEATQAFVTDGESVVAS